LFYIDASRPIDLTQARLRLVVYLQFSDAVKASRLAGRYTPIGRACPSAGNGDIERHGH
jgi:hypothetical protein